MYYITAAITYVMAAVVIIIDYLFFVECLLFMHLQMGLSKLGV